MKQYEQIFKADCLFHIVLVQPEIPANTGNIGRLCVATKAHLHLVGPLGFSLNDKYVKRAGLDYWPFLKFTTYQNYKEWEQKFSLKRCWFFSTKAEQSIYSCSFQKNDCLVFGSETKGLGEEVLKPRIQKSFRIPMSQEARSLNLSNAVAVSVYETLRQIT